MSQPPPGPAGTTAPAKVKVSAKTAAARAAEAEQLAQLRDESISEATWRAYLIAWGHWAKWANAHGRPVMPADPHDLGAWAHASVLPAADDLAADDLAADGVAEDGAVQQPAPRGARRAWKTSSTSSTAPRPGAARAAGPISASTLTKWMAAITYIHLRVGHPSPLADPELTQVLRGLRRTMAKTTASKPRQAPALMTEDIERVLTAMDTSPTRGQSLAEVRDRALILLAFTSAMRASELAALNVDDLEPDAGGLIVRIRSSKTDQEGAGTFIAIPWARRPHLCPVRAVDAWLARLRQQLDDQDRASTAVADDADEPPVLAGNCPTDPPVPAPSLRPGAVFAPAGP